METVEVLREARNLIEDPEHWTTYVMAENSLGLPTDPCLPEACQWCAVGAVVRINPGCYAKAIDHLSQSCRRLFSGYSITEVNDRLGHASVLAIYDEAINNLENSL